MEDYSANRKSKQAGSISTVDSYNQIPVTRANAGFSFGGGQDSGLQTSTMGLGGKRFFFFYINLCIIYLCYIP